MLCCEDKNGKMFKEQRKKGGDIRKWNKKKKKRARFDLLTSPKLQLQSCHAHGDCRITESSRLVQGTG